MQVQINTEKLDQAFASDAKEGAARAPAAAAAAKDVDLSRVMADEASAAASGFCEAWAKVRPFLNMAVNFVAMLFPNQAALAKTVIRVIDKQIIPAICNATE